MDAVSAVVKSGGIARAGRCGWLGLAALGIALAACADDRPPPPCPPVVRVPDAAQLIRFVPQGRDLTDVVFEASIGDLALTCEYEDDVVEAAMTIGISAVPGPANLDQTARLDYFVAIATRDQKILAREAFDLDIVFPGKLKGVVAVEEIAQRIPLRPGQSGADYVVYVGFKLTREELRYNQDNR